MKKLTLFLALSIGVAQAQVLPISIEDEANYKLKVWGSDSLEQGVFLIPDNDLFLMTGVTYSNKLPQITFNMINQKMEVLWTKVLRDEHFRFPYSGAKTWDGNFIFSGFIRKKGEKQFDALVFKTDPKGDTLWTLTVGGPNEERAYDVIPTKDKHYLVVGLTSSWGNGKQDGLILKINEAGKILWQKTFGEEKLDKFYSALELENGDVLVSGITNDNYPQNSDILLMRINKDGNVIWKKVIATSKGEFPTSVHLLKNNEFFIAGHSLERSDSLGALLFLHLDANGDVLKKDILQTPEDIKLEDSYLTKKGEFIGVGFVRESPKGTWDSILIKYNIHTKKHSLKKIEYSEFHDEIYNIQPAKGGSYFIAGQTMKNKGDNLLIVWK